MTVSIIPGSIQTMAVDAIVNAANEKLQRGGGVCGAIFNEVENAGDVRALIDACRAIGHCPTGGAVITPSFGLPAPFIIHAVGPVWSNEPHVLPPVLSPTDITELSLLASAYRSVLRLCREQGLKSVAIPSISTGIFGLPKELGAAIARAVTERDGGGLDIRLVGYDPTSMAALQAAPIPAATALLHGTGVLD